MKRNISTIIIFALLIGCEEIECTDIGENLCVVDNDYEYDPSDYLDRLNFMLKNSGINDLKEEVIVKIETDESILYEEESEEGKKRRIKGEAGLKSGGFHIYRQNGEEEFTYEIFYIRLTTSPHKFSHEVGHILEHQEGIANFNKNSPKDHRPNGLARCGDKVDRFFNKKEFEKLESFTCDPDWRNLEEYEKEQKEKEQKEKEKDKTKEKDK